MEIMSFIVKFKPVVAWPGVFVNLKCIISSRGEMKGKITLNIGVKKRDKKLKHNFLNNCCPIAIKNQWNL